MISYVSNYQKRRLYKIEQILELDICKKKMQLNSMTVAMKNRGANPGILD